MARRSPERVRYTCWDHIGLETDITVYHHGGEVHWLEVRSNATGEMILRQSFRGDGARSRAIAEAEYQWEAEGRRLRGEV